MDSDAAMFVFFCQTQSEIMDPCSAGSVSVVKRDGFLLAFTDDVDQFSAPLGEIAAHCDDRAVVHPQNVRLDQGFCHFWRYVDGWPGRARCASVIYPDVQPTELCDRVFCKLLDICQPADVAGGPADAGMD